MKRARNRTSRANPDQLALNSEYRGSLKRVKSPPPGNPLPPDFAGSCTIDGNSYWIAGWVNRHGPNPTLDLVFQLAVRGTAPSTAKPRDLRLQERSRSKPTQEEKDYNHYMQAPREHRESGTCPVCNRIGGVMDAKFGADPPY